MIDALVFPNVRECLTDLIDGTTHLGKTVNFVWWMQVDESGGPAGPFPLVHVTAKPGTEGYIDRVDPVMLECYSPGTSAVEILESIKASICGSDIDTPHGFLDSIRVTSTPEDGYYPSDTLNKAVASFDVVSRPVS